MYRFEICWQENVCGRMFPLTQFKGFTSRDNYEKYLRRLEKKGAKIVARIEDFRLIRK